MPRPLLFLNLAGALLCAGCEASAPAAAPRIVFDAVAHDVGRLNFGEHAEDAFTFRNAGGRNLAIEMVRTNCNDVATVEPSRALAPGQSGRVIVTLSADQTSGPCEHTITVYANDPAQPVTNLKLQAQIAADVSATPPQLYVGHLGRGQAAPFDVALSLAESVRVTEVTAASRIVEPRLDRNTGGRLRRVQVAIRQDAAPGSFQESFVVRTTSRKQPELIVPVVGVVDN